jgi:hypothetical protein
LHFTVCGKVVAIVTAKNYCKQTNSKKPDLGDLLAKNVEKTPFFANFYQTTTKLVGIQLSGV